jgi:hypothetical protein
MAIGDDAMTAAADAAAGRELELSPAQKRSGIIDGFHRAWPNSGAILVPAHRFYDRFWVCFPNETLPRGWIGYGHHHSFADTTEDRYMLYCLSLDVYRYRHDANNERKHMAFSTSFEGIIKRAKKALIPLTTKLVCYGHYDTHCRSVQDYISTKTKTVQGAYKKVTGIDMSYGSIKEVKSWPLLQEFEHLQRTGHKWISSSLQESAEKLVSSVYDRENAIANEDADMVYVWSDQNKIKLLQLGNCRVESVFKANLTNTVEFSYDRIEDLPDGLHGKISMLQVVGDETFLPNVGTRIGYGYFLVGGES